MVIVVVKLVVALGVPVSVDDGIVEEAGRVVFSAIVAEIVGEGAMEEGPTPPEREKRPE